MPQPAVVGEADHRTVLWGAERFQRPDAEAVQHLAGGLAAGQDEIGEDDVESRLGDDGGGHEVRQVADNLAGLAGIHVLGDDGHDYRLAGGQGLADRA